MDLRKETGVKKERAKSAKTYQQTKIQKEFISAGMTMGDFLSMNKRNEGLYESEFAGDSIMASPDATMKR